MSCLFEAMVGAVDRARAGDTAASAVILEVLFDIKKDIRTMAVDFAKLQSDVATLVGMLSPLEAQVATLQAAAAAGNTDAATQAAIDAIDATVKAALNPPAPTPTPPAAP